MRYFLAEESALKLLERPCVYNSKKDELYELDAEAFDFLLACAAEEGCEAADSEFIGYCISEGILTENKIHARKSLAVKSPEPSLRYLELQITRRCNLRCRHCFVRPSEDVELSPEDIGKILDEFEKMQGLRLLITGGEPLLHRRFAEINRMLPEYSFRKILLTNGTLLTGKLFGKLNVDEIQVSIDGLEAAHDSLRGKGTFKKSMKCIKNALSEGFEVSVSTMIHPGNLGDFEDLESLFKDIGIKDWTVDVPCAVGNLRENPTLILPPEKAGRYLGYGFGGGLHAGADGYACGLHLMAVMADGSCAKCSFYEAEPLGNFREGLASCWGRLRHLRLDELQCDCDALDICRGGCRYRASQTGSHLGKDLYRCAFHGKI